MVNNTVSQTSSVDSPFDNFPPDDSTLFSEDFSILPSFLPMDAFEQVKNSGKSVKKFANADVVINSNDKGLRMMNFVHDLQVCNSAEKRVVYLRACCWASYKRNVKYKVKLVLNQTETPKIVAAKCDKQCPASNSGCCCHVMAVVWKLEDMTRKSELIKSVPDSLPCTSKPREWGKGNKREVEFHPVMASNLVKPRHSSDLPGRKRRGVLSKLYDPRPPKCQKLDVEGMLKLKQDLQNINPNIPFAAMLPDEIPIPTVTTIVGTVAKGSTLHKQLQGFNPVTPQCTSSSTSSSVSVTAAEQQQLQSNGGASNLPFIQTQQPSVQSEKFIEKLTDEQKHIEKVTRGQADNPTWFEKKQNRITASICKDVFSHMNDQRKIPENLVKKIKSKGKPNKKVSYLQAKNLNYKSKGMIYGVENEPVAANLYREYLSSLPDVKAVTLQEVGLIVDTDNTVLAASPDRIAVIEYHNGDTEIRNVEIKCLESKQDFSPTNAIRDHQKETSFPFMETDSNKYEVKENHKYWFQSQMQMGITKLSLTDFVVFTSIRFPILVMNVTFSSRWQSEIKPRILAFYEQYIKDKNLK